jgi:hypothetical protein
VFNEPELTFHRRIVRELERNVNSRDWWLWIRFHLEEEGIDPSVSGIGAEVQEWLGTMNPDLKLEQPHRRQFGGAGIHVQVCATPRGAAYRADPTLVANPLPVAAFFLGA